MADKRINKQTNVDKIPDKKLYLFWFLLQMPNEITVVKIYAGDVDIAKQILRRQFQQTPFKQINYAGELIEHDKTYRKNLHPKYN